MANIPKEHQMHRPGGWLPEDHRIQKQWLDETVRQVDNNPKALHPVLKEFKELIENDTRLCLLFNSMFEQIPQKKPYGDDPNGKHQIRDHEHMLQVLDHLIYTAPAWNDHSHDVGLVGVPMNALFDWPMGTGSGYAVFLDPQVNRMLKKVLNVWGEYLQSPDSASVLDTRSSGWFGPTGLKDLEAVANVGETFYKFEEIFVCDPSAKHHGFNSWDNFFTRVFRDGIRPVAHPEDDAVIVNSCESNTYRVAYNVHRRDKFWVKGQPYSIVDMLAQDELAEQFVGGTIYQAFLSSLSYHRWHSPVSGRIVKAYVKDGTYYSEPLFEGFADPHGPNPDGEGTGQSYISAIATRAMVFIQADNPDIGLMCVMPVGMVEVSTCDVTVKVGEHVKKGDQLGMFHFGGSTHCLFFRKGVNVAGFPEPGRKYNVPVRSQLARVLSGGPARRMTGKTSVQYFRIMGL